MADQDRVAAPEPFPMTEEGIRQVVAERDRLQEALNAVRLALAEDDVMDALKLIAMALEAESNG